MRRALWPLGLLILLAGAEADAQAPEALWLVVDDDDDDLDGRADRLQADSVPVDDLLEVPRALLRGVDAASVAGDVARLVQNGTPYAEPWQAGTPGGPLRLQGLRRGSGKLRLVRGSRETLVPIQVVRLTLLGADNHKLDPVTAPLAISQRITNDESLPPSSRHDSVSPDQRNFRIELVAPEHAGRDQVVHLASIRIDGKHRDTLRTRLRRANPRTTFRSQFLRLVADEVDSRAPGVTDQVLQAALGDRVRLAWQSPVGWLSQDTRVGHRSAANTPSSILLGRVNVVILRSHAGGPPVIGRDDLSAMRIAREQVRSANQVWAQCGITFGGTGEVSITVAAPPPPSLLAIADGDGLPARGDGSVQLQINGNRLGPIPLQPGSTPLDTAMDVARVIEAAGFAVVVTRNPRTQFGVHPSADLVIRGRSGELAVLEPVRGRPLSTDSRQLMQIGIVDMSDGLQEFNNMNARAGSIEERALIKALADEDPATIDLFVINHFSLGTRQGEAFIEASSGSVVNTVVLDRNGLRQRDTAWTLAHEMGHVLLDEPLHPDNLGPDRPWLLMDSDSNRGTVYGPKRITASECARARYESGPRATPALLTTTD